MLRVGDELCTCMGIFHTCNNYMVILSLEEFTTS